MQQEVAQSLFQVYCLFVSYGHSLAHLKAKEIDFSLKCIYFTTDGTDYV